MIEVFIFRGSMTGDINTYFHGRDEGMYYQRSFNGSIETLGRRRVDIDDNWEELI